MKIATNNNYPSNATTQWEHNNHKDAENHTANLEKRKLKVWIVSSTTYDEIFVTISKPELQHGEKIIYETKIP